MPAKGTKKKNPRGKQLQVQMGLPKDLYEALEIAARERGLINPRNGTGNRTKLIEEMLMSLSYLDKAKIFYSSLKEYADLMNVEASLIQKVIVDILFPLGLWGEDEQRKKLEQIAAKRHHEKLWDLLKFYESINGLHVYVD